MKKMAKAAALVAAMVLTAGFCACQGKGSAGGAPKYSEKDAEKTAARLIMEETIVRSHTGDLPEKLVIPQGVTAIGKNAFSGESITSVFIPDSVTEIGGGAFWECENLTGVTIGNGVTTIGGSAFSRCYKLAGVTIPDTVTTIGEYAFSSTGLKSVSIPEGVTEIGEHAFSYCKSLKSVTIPEGVKEIGRKAFSDCANLESVSIPASVTFIGKEAFSYCENLKEAKYAGTKAQWDEIKTNVYYRNHVTGSWVFDDGKSVGKKPIGRFVLRCTDGDIFIEY